LFQLTYIQRMRWTIICSNSSIFFIFNVNFTLLDGCTSRFSNYIICAKFNSFQAFLKNKWEKGRFMMSQCCQIRITFWIRYNVINFLKGTRHVHKIFSNLFFQPPRYEEFSSNNFKILYSLNITTKFSTASLVVWSRHLTTHGKILGSNPIESTDFFSIKCSTMYCYNFICNNQEESKCSYSVIYLVKYLCFSCTNKI
jgi:hypothetical protein